LLIVIVIVIVKLLLFSKYKKSLSILFKPAKNSIHTAD